MWDLFLFFLGINRAKTNSRKFYWEFRNFYLQKRNIAIIIMLLSESAADHGSSGLENCEGISEKTEIRKG